MNRDLSALAGSTFDVVVVGGGINGAATAREAALRGLKVALVEAQDFASGTSSRSSKLIHGGLRYLEQRDFKLVHEARRERRLLLELAPHLAQPLPFLLPIYREDPYSRFKIGLGLSIYDLLGNLGASDRHRMISAQETLRNIPGLRGEGLLGGAIYHDSETEDARLCVENILDAAGHGAVATNYISVERLAVANATGQTSIVSAEARDQLSGRCFQISGRFWVNATGPWVDRFRALLPGYDGTRTVRLTKGTHVVLPSISDRYALFAAILPGDRIFVMMPWQGYSLLGTTDTDFDGDPAAVQPDSEDVDYLLRAVNRVLGEPVKAESVLGTFAGLRALALEPGRAPSENTREYRFHEDSWAANMISVCGGKLTTARALGEKLVDAIAPRLYPGSTSPQNHDSGSRANKLPNRNLAAHPSRLAPLPGGNTGPWEAFVNAATEEARRDFPIPAEVAGRIVRTYGSRWRDVLNPIHNQQRLAELLPGSSCLLAAEVAFSIQSEMALRIEDFLLRRSGLSWSACSLSEPVPAVAAIFAGHFGWGAEERDAAVQRFLNGAAGLRFKSAKTGRAVPSSPVFPQSANFGAAGSVVPEKLA
ncbi:MAG TPA: glycerol-3-phosphate dehydrogenase/oxidase [Terriglobia bacterium]|nr:glycerol-3-phosphate dehydrogenase/oxidase [Terriglobia bacterium]